MTECNILIDEHLLNFRTAIVVFADIGFLFDEELLGFFNNCSRFVRVVHIGDHVAIIAQLKHDDRHHILNDIGVFLFVLL